MLRHTASEARTNSFGSTFTVVSPIMAVSRSLLLLLQSVVVAVCSRRNLDIKTVETDSRVVALGLGLGRLPGVSRTFA